MKSPLLSSSKSGFLIVLLMMVATAFPMLSQAQRPSEPAQGQSSIEEPRQGESKQYQAPIRLKKAENAPEIQSGYSPARIHRTEESSFDRMLEGKLRPAQPNRPIPMMLLVLGTLFVLLWAAAIVGLILTIGTALGLILLIVAIAFLPLLILGVIFIIGGIIAGTSGRHKPE
ncbi:MAG: hypothetical protein U0176_03390 [Bacteroidia bacterium]